MCLFEKLFFGKSIMTRIIYLRIDAFGMLRSLFLFEYLRIYLERPSDDFYAHKRGFKRMMPQNDSIFQGFGMVYKSDQVDFVGIQL